MKTLPLGHGMPMLGLGTWMAAPGEVGKAVKMALGLGYRHIDCATAYGNEAEIGEALEAAMGGEIPDLELDRDDLWITSKLWNTEHRPESVRPALEKTLADLRLDALDLYLIHWPVPMRPDASFPLQAESFIHPEELSLAETWQALEATVDAGLVRHIGVSNFSLQKLETLLESARITPAVDQVELHPYLQQEDLLDFCKRNGIYLTAYAPLGSNERPEGMREEDEPILLEDPVIQSIADAHGITPAQVLLAWGVARGTAVIPKSTNAGRQAENLAAADIELSETDLARIAELDKGRRYFDGSFWVVPGGPHTVESLWSE